LPVFLKTGLLPGESLTEMYIHVDNFGRLQCVQDKVG
jgi:hypothetical protein